MTKSSAPATDAVTAGNRRRKLAIAGAVIVALFGLGGCYVSLGLDNPYVGFLADDGLYLLMADILAPGTVADLPVYAHVRTYSQLPPLFPLALGLTGGGTADLPVARVTVALTMLVAVGGYFFWLQQQRVKPLAGAALTLLFALMPITLIHTVDLWSEGMFIALSLAALISLDTARRAEFRLLPCVAAGLLVGCAMTTRSVGVALLPAMFVVCLQAPQRRAWFMWIALVVLLVPASFIDMGHGGVSYADLLRDRYAEAPVAALTEQLRASTAAARDALPYILFQWRAPAPVQWVIITIVALLMAGGLCAALRRLRPHAVYTVCYCAIVAVWPFPELSDRFLFPLVPLLLYYAYRGGGVLSHAFARRDDAFGRGVILALALLALPGIVRTLAAGFVAPATASAASFRTTRYWLDTSRENREQQAFDYLRVLHDTLPDLARHVPPDACIQTTLTNMVLVRARRIAVLPLPPARLRAGDFGECRFFYVSAKPVRGEVSMYPYSIVKPFVDVVAIYRRPMREGQGAGSSIAGMLLRQK